MLQILSILFFVRLKIVKDLKKKNRHVSISENKENMKNWCVKDFKVCFKSNGFVLSGNSHVLRNRCVLLHRLVENNMEHCMTLKMKELKEMCNSMSVDISSRDLMVKDVSDVLLNVADDAEEDILLLSLET